MTQLEEVQVLQVKADIERTNALTKEVEASTELKKLQADMQKVLIEHQKLQTELLKKDLKRG